MSESIDIYADQFLVTVGPWGTSISFMVNPPHPDPNKPVSPTTLATIRMSTEHAKVMVAVIKRHIQQIEEQMGQEARVSSKILGQLSIAPEDWEEFWKRKL